MKKNLIALLIPVVLTGCSPHPGSGVWDALDENPMGIDKLVLSFDGKGEFTSQGQQPVTWHCFWSATAKQVVSLQCTPSNDTDTEHRFTLSIDESGHASLNDKDRLIGTFKRGSGKPSIN